MIINLQMIKVLEQEKFQIIDSILFQTALQEKKRRCAFADPMGAAMPNRFYTLGSFTKERFTGKERDTETQLDYFGARYYQPTIGRWLAVDPMAEKYPSWSPYNYVGNNPINGVDPDGRDWYSVSEGGTTYFYYDSGLTQANAAQRLRNVGANAKYVGAQYRYFSKPTGRWIELYETGNRGHWKDVTAEVRALNLAAGYEAIGNLDPFTPVGDFFSIVASLIKYKAGKEDAWDVTISTFGIVGADILKVGKYGDEISAIAEKAIRNSAGDFVIRKLVQNEDDLLRVAEQAAGGSLDNFTEIKPNWWEGTLADGSKRRIEWQSVGEPHMNEGPHVKIMDFDPNKGRKGGYRVTEKYFIEGKENYYRK